MNSTKRSATTSKKKSNASSARAGEATGESGMSLNCAVQERWQKFGVGRASTYYVRALRMRNFPLRNKRGGAAIVAICSRTIARFETHRV